MTAHNETIEKVVQAFESNLNAGLTREQVQTKREKFGENKLHKQFFRTAYAGYPAPVCAVDVEQKASEFNEIQTLLLLITEYRFLSFPAGRPAHRDSSEFA